MSVKAHALQLLRHNAVLAGSCEYTPHQQSPKMTYLDNTVITTRLPYAPLQRTHGQ